MIYRDVNGKEGTRMLTGASGMTYGNVELLAQQGDLAFLADGIVEVVVPAQPPEPTPVHQVNPYGEYVGFYPLGDGNIEVPDAPTIEGRIWNTLTGQYEPMVAMDESGNLMEGVRASRVQGASYVLPTMYEGIPQHYQRWDFEAERWVVDMEAARTWAFNQLKSALYTDMGTESDTEFVSQVEVATWQIQEQEALAWKADNTVETPMIDGLLAARNLGETKAQFVDNVIYNAELLRSMVPLLGKYQRLRKQVKNATFPTELVDALAETGGA